MVEADVEDGDGDEEEADVDCVSSLKAATLSTFSGLDVGGSFYKKRKKKKSRSLHWVTVVAVVVSVKNPDCI